MRLNINLATQKYEAVKQFYVRWLTAIAVLGAITIILLGLAWLNYTGSKESTQRIHELEQRIATLQKQRAQAQEISNRPENHDVIAEKNFWNKQFTRRSFSWTQLFNDLQRIMPPRAFVSSVHPEITPENRVKLTLTIKGDTHENALELVKRMEASNRFRSPLISADAPEKDSRTGQTLHKLDIVTFYTPAGAPIPHSGVKEGL